ncbi:hypothetical protein [Syntrophobacter fumaroxidans]|uniref:Uncharacterized protein n=1 Tax=Syntrophobacter fumaroxidans (strain DSM 10017 / MPOB) TaxID=335543 RepID=A0LN67_SYNFM|nr:hypothetical protein [Syntrophobacter fumaroxidans]ABK18869.1 hypothetical protein Sfum_3196 [Syntrophobacter fumaroxidans MPOB]
MKPGAGDANRTTIQWSRLEDEFERFESDPQDCSLDCRLFVRSLSAPVPGFVERLLKRRISREESREEAIRALYCFLLQKRYDERLNLLHFAFYIFDEQTCLPAEIIDRTPFPHEDGTPKFRHINDPGFDIES